MNTLLLVIFVALFLGGCQLSLPRTAMRVTPAETWAPQPAVEPIGDQA